jgi:hypothetical protein
MMRFLVPLLLLASVIFTNRLIVDDPDMSIHGYDSKSYVETAEAFPHLPTVNMPHQHAQRLIGPWIVGGIIKISPLSFYWTFELVTFLLLFGILYVNWRTCELLNVDKQTKLIVASLLAFNPYFSRFYFAIPTYIGDLLFLLGMSIVVQALLFLRLRILLIGLFIAAVGRQTAILLLPAVCFWVIFHKDWKKFGVHFRGTIAVLSVFIVFGIYFVTDWLAYKINPVSINAEHVLGLFHWLVDVFQGKDPGFSQHWVPLVPTVISANVGPFAGFLAYLLRGFLSLVIPLGMIFAVTGWGGFIKGRSLEYSILLFMSLTILSQPILAGPSLTGHPVVRLGMFCLPALVVAFALLTKEAKFKIRWNTKALALVVAVLFISSFHHRYSLLWQGTVNDSPIFAGMYFVCAVILFVLFKRQKSS